MSSPTWTPAALASEARGLGGAAWRLVEAQHAVSTLKLVDSLEEQALLEGLIETVKPALPPDCRHLHYLLATPFRYGAPYPIGSRFRRAGRTEGVFYGAESPETAVAEIAFYRLLFFADSPATPWPRNAGDYSAFSARYLTEQGLDLTAPPLSDDDALWCHPTDYGPCQALAEAGRAAGIEAIRYRSQRDPGGGANLALLVCRVFTAPEPRDHQTWRLQFGPRGVQALCDFPRRRLEFDREAFADDPRMAEMVWER